mgnify:FL=1
MAKKEQKAQPARRSVHDVAREMIPVLINWAKEGQAHTYGELAKAVGFNCNRISRHLELIGTWLIGLGEKKGKRIPPLTLTIVLQGTGLPNPSIFEQHPNLEILQNVLEECAGYDWSWVLEEIQTF